MINDNRLVIVYKPNSSVNVQLLIEYRNMKLFHTFHVAALAVSFERVIHPNSLEFTFTFFSSSYVDNMTALGVGSTFYFHSRHST